MRLARTPAWPSRDVPSLPMTARRLRAAPTVPATLLDGFAAIRRELEIPTAFPDDVLAEADRVARGGFAVAGRTDMRATEFVTIDPAGSRDLDQALCIDRDGDGFVVRYAIADLDAWVPPGGAIEGETGYQCLSNGDCHLLVVNRALGKLFEMWRADIRSPMVFNGGCLAVWDMARAYPPNLRGEYCTSADAAGFPITPLLPTADEVFAAVQAQGDVGHALRFILPNSRIRRRVYVHPSTHSTPSTSGGATLPPYGAHFRLRSDYPLGRLPNEAARTIARSLQRFGMFLSDGGDIPVTFRGDRSTKHKWAEMGFDSHSLFGINVTDFDMVDGGARFTWNMDCVRNP